MPAVAVAAITAAATAIVPAVFFSAAHYALVFLGAIFLVLHIRIHDFDNENDLLFFLLGFYGMSAELIPQSGKNLAGIARVFLGIHPEFE